MMIFAFLTTTLIWIALPTAEARHHGSWSQLALGVTRWLDDASPRQLERIQSERRRNQRRILADSETDGITCDTALTQCMGSTRCTECFTEMASKEMNWASVPKSVACKDALDTIYNGGHCSSLALDTKAEDAFCVAFEACVKPKKLTPAEKNATSIDCDKLESCDFDGIHKQFLGDGICHENLPGCYNSAICGYDMGDCCEDTCLSFYGNDDEEATRTVCGKEGYFCRDPYSVNCNSRLSEECGGHKDWEEDDYFTPYECENTTSYRLVLYDSFGDGWDETTLKIQEKDKEKPIFEGSLEYGSVGVKYICLSTTQACYTAVAKGGIWGKEVSWEVRPLREGAPAIASGGSPMECQFAVNGDSCDTTCNGRTDEDPTDDPDYKNFKEMYTCIQDKCSIQMATCTKDKSCNNCFASRDMTPQYCFAIDAFNSLVDCALCSCTDDSKSQFCFNRDGTNENHNDGEDGYPYCTPSQVMQGSEALIEFNNCTDFDEIAMLMMDFDNDHFGDLDTFESCAHEYRKNTNHGGHTAMECMRILVNAIDQNAQQNKVDPDLTEAVAALSNLLYQNGEGFCDCAVDANLNCPLCASFVNFKTLLYESVDACIALDEIDCDAWSEFYTPCRMKLDEKFNNQINFDDHIQCKFVHDGCGDSGPFPSFRRLDCKTNNEVTQEAWDFYLSFAKGCLKDDDSNPYPIPPPAPVPIPTPSAPYGPTPYRPDGGSSPGRKPYVPPEKRDKNKPDDVKPSDGNDKGDQKSPTDISPSKTQEQPKKKKTHFWRNLFWFLVLGGGGYFYYKRYGLSLEGVLDFYRFVRSKIRRGRGYSSNNNYGGPMYSGLAMESSMTSSTSFEPATLPPPPSAVDGSYYI